MKTGLFHDPLFQEHNTGAHPENAGRLAAIHTELKQRGLLQRLELRAPRPATQEEITGIHTLAYMRRVEEATLQGKPFLDTPDCLLSERTYEVALNGAGAMLDAVVDVAEGRLDNAFIACRPPGHHAEQSHAMGFCYFNNVAIAADWLTRHMGYERVLIFDFDVHHGNGTQHAFDTRKDVFFCSIHQHPMTLFPGTGFAEEIGHGEGRGYTLNLPMPPLSTDADYLRVFQNRLLPTFAEYNPQFILISAGFDAHAEDPLASMSLSRAGFDALLQGMKRLAEAHCGGRLVSALEGGYHYDHLAACVASHLSILRSDTGETGD